MKATRNIEGQLKTYCALYDTAGSGEYEDDILRFDWLTDEEIKVKNERMRTLEGHEDLRWIPFDVEQEEHEDSPCLDMDLNY